MTIKQSHLIMLAGLGLVVFTLSLLSDVLLPFVLAFVLAYWLDPLADRLEALGMRRVFATAFITLCFTVVLGLALAFGAPLLVEQISALIKVLPGYTESFQNWLEAQQVGGLAGDFIASLNDGLSVGLRSLAQGLVLSGLSVIGVLGVFVITPIVTIYMLNDWDRMVAAIDRLLPHEQATLIRDLAGQIDEILSGFLRGQALVCLALAVIYSVGLALVGLQGALVLGVLAGLVSFVPYVGATFGIVTAVILALGQFGLNYTIGLQLAAVFIVGQFVEGNFLTPRLVGERVRLHPVWIIFALLAMGQLFGFLGLLLAVPVAAVLGVLVRYAASVYTRDYVDIGQDKTDG
jgi:predicted PurR-regulated permease PerM